MKRIIKACLASLVTCMLVLTLNAVNALASTGIETCDLTAHVFCDRELSPGQSVEILASSDYISFVLLNNNEPGDRNGKIENNSNYATYSVGENKNYLAYFPKQEQTEILKISNTDDIAEGVQYWRFYRRPTEVVKLTKAFAAN